MIMHVLFLFSLSFVDLQLHILPFRSSASEDDKNLLGTHNVAFQLRKEPQIYNYTLMIKILRK